MTESCAAAAAVDNRFLLAQWVDLLEDDSFRRFWFMRLASHGATNALTYSLLVFTVRHSDSALATGGAAADAASCPPRCSAPSPASRRPPAARPDPVRVLHPARRPRLRPDRRQGQPAVASTPSRLGLGVVTQFAVPAESAVLPHIVRSRNLVAANSFINLGTLASQVLGMLILAPMLLKTTNGDPLLFILVLLYILSAVLITVIPQFHFASNEQGRRVCR